MKLACLVLFFALDLAGKCDQYIRFQAYIHKSQAGDENSQVYHGCKKGCFDNSTVTEDGARKCEKCSNIEDEELCRSYTRGCHWTKGGKCGSASCSQIGKVYDQDVGDLNPLAVKRCVEGTAEEQYYNNLYINDVLLGGNPNLLLPQSIQTYGSGNRLCEPRRRECEISHNKTYYDDRVLYYGSVTDWTYRYWKNANEAASNDQKLQLELCRTEYEKCVSGCNGGGVEMLPVTHAGVAAQRKSCHVISGCMYSKSNNRCSVWAVWAFVLVLVILILVALVAVGVVCFLVLSQLKSSSGGGKKPKVSDSVSGGDGGGEGRPAEPFDVGGGGDEGKPKEVSDVSS